MKTVTTRRRGRKSTATATETSTTSQPDHHLASHPESSLSDCDPLSDSDACGSCNDNGSDSEPESPHQNARPAAGDRRPTRTRRSASATRPVAPSSRKRPRTQAASDSDDAASSQTSSGGDDDDDDSEDDVPAKRRPPTKRAKTVPPPASEPSSAAAAKPKRKAPKRVSSATTASDTMTVARLANASKLVGAHISVAGGLENATVNAMKIGCNAMSFFLTSPRTWKSKPLTSETIAAFKHNCTAHGYAPDACMIPHGSYLVNLGNPDSELRQKSYDFFLDELKRCDALGIKYYNFHPGSSVGKCTPAECIQHIAACVNRALAATSSVHAVFENTAGQGHVVGHSWEQLRDLIALVDNKSRVGVCLDTCHMFAAGYDLRTKETFDKSFTQFDSIVGFEYLKAFHVNDSKGALGSKKDRHAPLGTGEIGLEPFRWLMQKPEFDGKLFILETPDECNWAGEIKVLHSYMLESSSETAAPVDED